MLSKLSKTKLNGQATWIESQESFTPSELFGNGSLSQESMLPHRFQTAFHGIVSVSGALEAVGCRLQTETSASAMTALGCVFESFEAGIRDWLCAVALMLPFRCSYLPPCVVERTLPELAPPVLTRRSLVSFSQKITCRYRAAPVKRCWKGVPASTDGIVSST